ncbi:MAG: hypothetical protein DRR00_28475 [Candidatus Parabeggiatoa sp. nov. 3]|nr:MAG: hypothetical protein DRR00_28475 [Gammaproteobacteria bacterium]
MPVILRPAWNACYFAACLECLLFCGPLGMPVILRIAKIDNDPFFGWECARSMITAHISYQHFDIIDIL